MNVNVGREYFHTVSHSFEHSVSHCILSQIASLLTSKARYLPETLNTHCVQVPGRFRVRVGEGEGWGMLFPTVLALFFDRLVRVGHTQSSDTALNAMSTVSKGQGQAW